MLKFSPNVINLDLISLSNLASNKATRWGPHVTGLVTSKRRITPPAADTEKWPSPETESLEPICYPRVISYNHLPCLTKAHGAPNSTLQGRKQGSERCGKDLPMSPNMAGTQKSAGFFLAHSLFFMSLQSFSAFWFIFFWGGGSSQWCWESTSTGEPLINCNHQ